MPLTTLGDGRTLQWSEGGDPDGHPVVFCHGTPDTRRASWSGHDAAARAGVRLVAANRPGYGASTPAPPSYQRPADDLVALADSLAIERFALLGMSVGGTFALATAARHPDRVRAVATVGCPGPVTSMDPPYPRDDLDDEGRAFFDDLAAGTTDVNVERVRPGFADFRRLIDPDDPDDDALAQRWVESLPTEDRVLVESAPASERAAAAREAIGVPDGYLADAALVFAPWPFDLADVRCPVTLWYGERDRQAPPRHGTWLAGHLPSAELRILAGLGHLESLVRSWPEVLARLA